MMDELTMTCATVPPPARLVLGPMLFNRPPATLHDLYARIADETDIDVVHLGEVVCAKRMPFIDPHLPAIVDRLRRAGKQVVISTLALVQGARETALVRDLTAGDDWLIEANDMAAIHGLAGRPHVVGPHVNVYNPASLACLAALGAIRVCLPAELPMAGIAALAAARGPAAIEVQVFGRAPLAISARCYHARAHGLHKDGCRYVCGQDPDGMPVDTVDGQPFLAVNGLQTLSYGCLELSGWIGDLRAAGVTAFRLSPHDLDMVALARLYRAVIDGRMTGPEAAAAIRPLLGGMPPINGFLAGTAGMAWQPRAE